MTALRKRLDRLPHRLCVAYGTACVERVIPIFEAFVVDSAPRKAIGKVWQWACGQETTRRTRRSWLQAVQQTTPDADQLGLIYAPAMWVGVGVTHLLAAIDDDPAENIERAINNAHDAVAAFTDQDDLSTRLEAKWQKRALQLVESLADQPVKRAMFGTMNMQNPVWADRIPEQ